MLKRGFWGFSLLLWLGLGLASPAQDLFDEANRLLHTYYGGFAQLRAEELRSKYQLELDKACAQEVTCPTQRAHSVIQALVAEIGDRHTRYFTPEEYAEIQQRLSGGNSSRPQLGVQLRVVPGLEGLLVVDVLSETPAEEAGLRRGDRILAINGEALPAAEAERMGFLRERVSEAPLTLTIQRAQARLQVVLYPRIISLRQLPKLSLRPDGVAVLHIPSFSGYQQVGPRIHALVRQAQSAGARAMVVDLRNNGGGLLSECLVGAGAFVGETYRRLQDNLRVSEQGYKDGYYYHRAGGRDRPQYLVEPAQWSGPVVVLVNERTASCAEYFTFDLQENRKAIVVGQATAGVGNTATTFLRLSDGSGLQITTAKAQRKDGSFYPERVIPDLILAEDWQALAEGRDLLLEKALELLDTSPKAGGYGRVRAALPSG
ncbi:MAG: S41 family peptidase [Meiothermus sp.]|uniref:S41 family peptidase n=1 Tax=Meiothermus sp. TaxID=1955249 RepID=UPI0025E39D54|nr:S41 family peptidase [Meiothermus sp.]MCS7059008.1 S41 family peptidase [Meiothermus sp.]MCS7194189.1 S41 family peptidase [Meiothermus sp.]MCX7741180.1 S41 family peptidase [Meiothermus sp.]MDW8090050.1 S41 family peptidase [Meiothermus sp.]MDW8480698.1 S41 family peptidase [Meiothermus sp.]